MTYYKTLKAAANLKAGALRDTLVVAAARDAAREISALEFAEDAKAMGINPPQRCWKLFDTCYGATAIPQQVNANWEMAR